jgi:hypothetical protein
MTKLSLRSKLIPVQGCQPVKRAQGCQTQQSCQDCQSLQGAESYQTVHCVQGCQSVNISKDSFDDSDDDFEPTPPKQKFKVINEKSKNIQRSLFNNRKRRDVYCTNGDDIASEDIISTARLTPECSVSSPVHASIQSASVKENTFTEISNRPVTSFDFLPSTVEINNQKIFSNNTLKTLNKIKNKRIASVEPLSKKTGFVYEDHIRKNYHNGSNSPDQDNISIISDTSQTFMDFNKASFFRAPTNAKRAVNVDTDLQLLYCP